MRHLLRPPANVRDIALLLTRVLLGVAIMAHGWQKIHTNGMDTTIGAFSKMGIPLPGVSAWFTALVELVGGAMILIGLLTPVAAFLLSSTMLGAWWFVHRGHGVFIAQHGWELVGVYGAAALALVGAGAGRISVDGALGRDSTRDSYAYESGSTRRR